MVQLWPWVSLFSVSQQAAGWRLPRHLHLLQMASLNSWLWKSFGYIEPWWPISSSILSVVIEKSLFLTFSTSSFSNILGNQFGDKLTADVFLHWESEAEHKPSPPLALPHMAHFCVSAPTGYFCARNDHFPQMVNLGSTSQCRMRRYVLFPSNANSLLVWDRLGEARTRHISLITNLQWWSPVWSPVWTPVWTPVQRLAHRLCSPVWVEWAPPAPHLAICKDEKWSSNPGQAVAQCH